jgi:hypothetical protein
VKYNRTDVLDTGLGIPELKRYLRVVTLEDTMTVHNAFLDRGFKEAGS